MLHTSQTTSKFLKISLKKKKLYPFSDYCKFSKFKKN